MNFFLPSRRERRSLQGYGASSSGVWSSVWVSHYDGFKDELAKAPRGAARFVSRNYTFEEGSMAGILAELK